MQDLVMCHHGTRTNPGQPFSYQVAIWQHSRCVSARNYKVAKWQHLYVGGAEWELEIT